MEEPGAECVTGVDIL